MSTLASKLCLVEFNSFAFLFNAHVNCFTQIQPIISKNLKKFWGLAFLTWASKKPSRNCPEHPSNNIKHIWMQNNNSWEGLNPNMINLIPRTDFLITTLCLFQHLWAMAEETPASTHTLPDRQRPDRTQRRLLHGPLHPSLQKRRLFPLD